MQSNVVRLALRGARKARPRHNMVRYLREHELLDVVLVPLRALVELEDRVDAFFGRDKDRPLDDGGDGLNLRPALEVEGRFGGRASKGR